jgi:hypothetical protein
MAADSVNSEARALPTADELAQALKVEVYDNKGKSTPLGELANGQRTALIFIRHFCKQSDIKYVLSHTLT